MISRLRRPRLRWRHISLSTTVEALTTNPHELRLDKNLESLVLWSQEITDRLDGIESFKGDFNQYGIPVGHGAVP